MTNPIIRWGILGTARIASKIIPAIRATPDAELLAIASRDANKAADHARQHEIPRAYGNYEALLQDGQIDAIYIPLPPAHHAEWTIRALEHGKHVLCEKPLAHSLEDAKAMVAAARRHQRLLVDGVMWRHHPRTADMASFLRSGELGALRRITSAFTFVGDRLDANDLRFRPELGGGSLLDLGWYCVGASLWAIQDFPVEVWASGRFEGGVDRSFSGWMRFPNDTIASFDCGFETAARRWLEIAGSGGSLICDDFTRPWQEDRARFWKHEQFGKALEVRSAAANQETALIAEFCRLCRLGIFVDAWAIESLKVQAVCEALLESATRGGIVTIPANCF